MNKKLPPDSFDFYYALGPGRSYAAVAEKYKTTKRTVTSLAVRERWQDKIVELERRARERSDTKVVETIEAMQTRHLKSLQAVHARALEALRQMPLSSAMEAVRALEMVIRQERLLRGEPTDRNAVDLEAITKREIRELLVVGGDPSDDWSEEA